MNQFTKSLLYPVSIVLIIIIIAIIFFQKDSSPLISTPAPSNPTGSNEEWILMFEDEFDGADLDQNKWTTCYWWAIEGCTIASNNELEWYQPENVFIDEGILFLQARKGETQAPDGRLFPYTSGLVTTGKQVSDNSIPHNFIFQYGYAEIRAQVPSGQGVWPAFWLLPADHYSKPEIDIMEILGDEPNMAHMTFHFINEFEETVQYGETVQSDENFSDGWHTFGIDWQPDMLVWYVDGVEVWRYKSSLYIPDEPMYLLLNLAIGGDWPGDPDEQTRFPNEFVIDYVKVWRRPSDPLVVPLVADSYFSNDESEQNFGEALYLSIDGDPEKITLLKFDAAQLNISGIEAASLFVRTGADLDDASQQTAVIHQLISGDWDEETAVSRDAIELGPIIGHIFAPESDTTYEIELDTAVISSLIDQEIILAIVSDRDDGLHLVSKENVTHMPQLIVTPNDS